jgi:hypothetical protein
VTGGDPLAARLSHDSPTVRRIAAIDAQAREVLDDSLLHRVVMLACDDPDARTRMLLARAIERHAPGRPVARDLLPALHAAVATNDEPLSRHAQLLARDAVEASLVRE